MLGQRWYHLGLWVALSLRLFALDVQLLRRGVGSFAEASIGLVRRHSQVIQRVRLAKVV